MKVSLFLYWHTIRYLRAVQIIERLKKKFRRNNIDLSPVGSLRLRCGDWVMPAICEQRQVASNTFCFLNETHTISKPSDWNNSRWSKLWLYNLHYFDDLIAANAKQRVEWHRALIQRWIDETPPGVGDGWEPYPSSLRIVNWIKWSLISGFQMEQRWVHSLAVQTRYLQDNLEYHILGNHLFANAKALLFAGLYFEGEEAETWYECGLRIVEQELPEQVLTDGGNFELSPMYHAIFLIDLLDLINLHRAFRCVIPTVIEVVIPKMMNWLQCMTHPDGDIAFFNDAAIGVTPSVAEIVNYANRLGFYANYDISNVVELSESGYSCVKNSYMTAVIDRAKVGPDYLPGHAHADTLSFELSLFGKRIIVNGGTGEYGTGTERQRQRGTAAHATVAIDGENSSEVWGGFRVARRAQVFGVETKVFPDSIELAASHDGYKRLTSSPIHHRRWRFLEGSMEVEDIITGRGGAHELVAHFPLHPDVEIIQYSTDYAVLQSGKRTIEISFTGNGKLLISPFNYCPQFGVNIETQQLLYKVFGQLPVTIKTTIDW